MGTSLIFTFDFDLFLRIKFLIASDLKINSFKMAFLDLMNELLLAYTELPDAGTGGQEGYDNFL